MMFRIFEKIANIKLNAFDKLIKNQQVIDNLQEKILIITDLAKLNNSNPVKLLARLSKVSTIKKSKRKKTTNDTPEEEWKTSKETPIFQEKKFKTNHLSKKLKVLLLLFFTLYIIYTAIFIIVYTYSFNQLDDITKTLENSANSEENILLFISIFQMFHYFTYDPSVFREMIPNVMREIPEDDDENFLISLLNQLQVDWQNEVDYKTGKNSIPDHSDIINITCDAMYREMNDSMFTSIILSNPEMNYEQ